jgi:hypothetical protein
MALLPVLVQKMNLLNCCWLVVGWFMRLTVIKLARYGFVVVVRVILDSSNMLFLCTPMHHIRLLSRGIVKKIFLNCRQMVCLPRKGGGRRLQKWMFHE